MVPRTSLTPWLFWMAPPQEESCLGLSILMVRLEVNGVVASVVLRSLVVDLESGDAMARAARSTDNIVVRSFMIAERSISVVAIW